MWDVVAFPAFYPLSFILKPILNSINHTKNVRWNTRKQFTVQFFFKLTVFSLEGCFVPLHLFSFLLAFVLYANAFWHFGHVNDFFHVLRLYAHSFLRIKNFVQLRHLKFDDWSTLGWISISFFYNLNNMSVISDNLKKKHHSDSHPGSRSAHDWGDFSAAPSWFLHRKKIMLKACISNLQIILIVLYVMWRNHNLRIVLFLDQYLHNHQFLATIKVKL